jgi:hypothetical protein
LPYCRYAVDAGKQINTVADALDYLILPAIVAVYTAEMLQVSIAVSDTQEI